MSDEERQRWRECLAAWHEAREEGREPFGV